MPFTLRLTIQVVLRHELQMCDAAGEWQYVMATLTSNRQLLYERPKKGGGGGGGSTRGADAAAATRASQGGGGSSAALRQPPDETSPAPIRVQQDWLALRSREMSSGRSSSRTSA